MPLTDTRNNPWALSATVKAGDVLKTDGGFTCIGNHTTVTVHEDAEGLYFECEEGHHYLCGQVGDDGELIGLYPAGGAPAHEAVAAETDPPQPQAA